MPILKNTEAAEAAEAQNKACWALEHLSTSPDTLKDAGKKGGAVCGSRERDVPRGSLHARSLHNTENEPRLLNHFAYMQGKKGPALITNEEDIAAFGFKLNDIVRTPLGITAVVIGVK